MVIETEQLLEMSGVSEEEAIEPPVSFDMEETDFDDSAFDGLQSMEED